MEINKQLFEDVLSGKLKGTFVLRNGDNIKSTLLERDFSSIYQYKFKSWCILYANTGLADRLNSGNCNYDIIDFIPDTDMKQNELTIEIPDGKIVDWDKSKKQNKIVFKDKQLTYKDVCKKLFEKTLYYIDIHGRISTNNTECIIDSNNASTEHQLECILAKNKLANVAKYLNDGWKPGKTDIGQFNAWVLYLTPNKDYIGCVKIINCTSNSNVLFKSKELAQQAIEILGEKTVKLALEPLGI